MEQFLPAAYTQKKHTSAQKKKSSCLYSRAVLTYVHVPGSFKTITTKKHFLINHYLQTYTRKSKCEWTCHLPLPLPHLTFLPLTLFFKPQKAFLPSFSLSLSRSLCRSRCPLLSSCTPVNHYHIYTYISVRLFEGLTFVLVHLFFSSFSSVCLTFFVLANRNSLTSPFLRCQGLYVDSLVSSLSDRIRSVFIFPALLCCVYCCFVLFFLYCERTHSRQVEYVLRTIPILFSCVFRIGLTRPGALAHFVALTDTSTKGQPA